MDKKWKLYILMCRDGTYYTGITDDLDRRLKAHNSGKGAKYTRGRGPVRLVYLEFCDSHSAALKREIEVKKLDREQKKKLISTYEPDNTSEIANVLPDERIDPEA